MKDPKMIKKREYEYLHREYGFILACIRTVFFPYSDESSAIKKVGVDWIKEEDDWLKREVAFLEKYGEKGFLSRRDSFFKSLPPISTDED